jgi:hypothetical protein
LWATAATAAPITIAYEDSFSVQTHFVGPRVNSASTSLGLNYTPTLFDTKLGTLLRADREMDTTWTLDVTMKDAQADVIFRLWEQSQLQFGTLQFGGQTVPCVPDDNGCTGTLSLVRSLRDGRGIDRGDADHLKSIFIDGGPASSYSLTGDFMVVGNGATITDIVGTWSGTIRVTYTYEPVAETPPAFLVAIGGLGLFAARRRRPLFG